MKKAYSILFVILLITTTSFSQTGTIKIAKPKQTPTQEPVVKAKYRRAMIASVSSNYTFKGINQVGYEAELWMGISGNHFYVGLKYCNENQYYKLSSSNLEPLQAVTSYSKSENKADYLKIPIGISNNMLIGNIKKKNGRHMHFTLAIVPEYLIKTKNQYGRLNYSDFNKFNLSGFIQLGFPIFDTRYSMNVSYSRDFLNNLKDNNLYNETGAIIGKQKSKTNIISLSLSYRFLVGKK